MNASMMMQESRDFYCDVIMDESEKMNQYGKAAADTQSAGVWQ